MWKEFLNRRKRRNKKDHKSSEVSTWKPTFDVLESRNTTNSPINAVQGMLTTGGAALLIQLTQVQLAPSATLPRWQAGGTSDFSAGQGADLARLDQEHLFVYSGGQGELSQPWHASAEQQGSAPVGSFSYLSASDSQRDLVTGSAQTAESSGDQSDPSQEGDEPDGTHVPQGAATEANSLLSWSVPTEGSPSAGGARESGVGSQSGAMTLSDSVGNGSPPSAPPPSGQSANAANIASSDNPLATVAAGSAASSSGSAAKTRSLPAKVGAQLLGQMPISFEQNVGQFGSSVQYEANAQGYQLYLTNSQAQLVLDTPSSAQSASGSSQSNATGELLDMQFVGATPNPTIVGSSPLSMRSNYFLGSQSYTDIQSFQSVTYQNLYNGIDLTFSSAASDPQEVEYSFTLQPGADPSQIHLKMTGTAATSVDKNGDLVLTSPGGKTFEDLAPVVYQQQGDSNQPIASRFAMEADGSVGFQLGNYDHTKSLYLDPVLSYQSYLGSSSGSTTLFGVAVDPAGYIYVAGNFNTSAPALSPEPVVEVMKLSPDGQSIIYKDTLGSGHTNSCDGYGLAFDSSYDAYVLCESQGGFPTTSNALQGTFQGSTWDAAVAEISAAGDVLMNGTYLAGTGTNTVGPGGGNIAVGANDDVYVTGETNSTNFPTTTGAYQTSNQGGYDAFLTVYTPGLLHYAYSTYLGGSGTDAGDALALDPAGDVYVTGLTTSSNFPHTSGAYQTSLGGTQNAFVTEFTIGGTNGFTYQASTYLGGSGTDQANGIVVTPAGNVALTGSTTSTNFPTQYAFQSSNGGGTDAFVTELAPNLTALVMSSYLGGSSTDVGNGIATDSSSDLYIVGSTTSTNFPTNNAVQSSNGGGTDAFISEVTLSGATSTLTYSTYDGGSGTDNGYAIATDPNGNAVFVGSTTSTNLPTVNPYQSAKSGSTCGFLGRIIPGSVVPVFTSISPAGGTIYGTQVTDSQNLTLNGTASAGATVTITRSDIGVIGTATANGSGVWSFNYSGTTLPAGTYSFTATATENGIVSNASAPYLVTVDLTAPTVTINAPSSTYALEPTIQVFANDNVGLATTTTVTIDLDPADNGSWSDPDYMTATMTNGFAQFQLSPALTVGNTVGIRAHVSDLAGNSGTSNAETITVNSIGNPSSASGSQVSESPFGDSGVTGTPGGYQDGMALYQTGDNNYQYALDLDQSPGASMSGNPFLAYNSDTASPQPVIEATVQTSNAVALPSTATVTLTWNGTAQTAQTFNLPAGDQGHALVFAEQVSSAVTSTGRYDWSMQIKLNYATPVTVTASGTSYVVVNSGGLGNGWSYGPTEQLYALSASGSDPAGVLAAFGSGGWAFYQTSGSSYTSPAGDSGTLSNVMGGGYKYTMADGEVRNFNNNGYETSSVSADGLSTIAYAYNGSNQLQTVSSPDGALATFTYAASKLSTINVDGTRTYTFTFSGNNLVSIKDPDSNVATYAYDSNSHMTAMQYGGQSENWAYTNGAVTSYTLGTLSPTTVAPAVLQGLPSTPALDTVWGSATNADGGETRYQTDAQGRLVEQIDADGGTWTYTRGNGWVTAATDPVGNTTTYTLDTLGYPTTVTYADGSTMQNYYQSAFHALTMTLDQDNNATKYTYDGEGHTLTMTDGVGDVTSYAYYTANGLLESVTQPNGGVTTYVYDTDRRPSTTTDALADVTTMTYDGNGNPKTTVDPLGNTTTFSYDPMGNMLTKTNALGNTWTYTYDAEGHQLTATDPDGTQTSYVYNAAGQLYQTTLANGSTLQNSDIETFDGAGFLSTERDPMGITTTYTLDPMGQTVATLNSQGQETQTRYDLDGRVVASIDPLGEQTQYVYDHVGNRTESIDAAGNITTSVYDPAHNLLTTVDPLGNRTSYSYDADNRQATIEDPLGNVTTTAYKDSNAIATVDPLGNRTTFSYDLLNRQIATTDALNETATVVYDKDSNVMQQIDHEGHVTTFLYDKVNEQTGTIDPLGDRSTVVYDAAGNVVNSIDAMGHTTTYVLDALERPVATIDPAGDMTTVLLDAMGDQTGSIDGLGNGSLSFYDAQGQGIATVNPLGGVTLEKYDADGNMIALTDPDGNTTIFVYNNLNEQVNEIDPLNHTSTMVYDADRRLNKQIDADGQEIDYTYDGDSRLTEEVWKNSSGTTVNTQTFVYDAAGNTTLAEDQNGAYTFTYDALNRVQSVTDMFGVALTFTYDADGNRTLIQDSFGGLTTSVYNADNLLQTRELTAAGTTERIDLTYNPDRLESTQTLSNNLSGTSVLGMATYTYDAASRIQNIQQSGNGTLFANYTYTYDHNSNVTSETLNGSTTSYSYDAAQELTNDSVNTYTYDLNGNRTMAGYVTGAANELLNDGTWTYTYDNNGNMTEKSMGSSATTWYYTYNDKNQMVTADEYSAPGGTLQQATTYGYDVLGNLMQESTTSGGSTSTTRYVQDGWNPDKPKPVGNENFDQLMALDGSNTLLTRYLNGDGVDQTVARIAIATGVGTWYWTDRLGSTRFLTDNSGNVLDQVTYSGCGVILAQTHAQYSDQHLFAGSLTDPVTGLALTSARVYDPMTGAWRQRDPKGFAAWDTNLYRFAHNSPANGTDPSGLEWNWPGAWAGLATGAIAGGIAGGLIAGPTGVLVPVGIVVGGIAGGGVGFVGGGLGTNLVAKHVFGLNPNTMTVWQSIGIGGGIGVPLGGAAGVAAPVVTSLLTGSFWGSPIAGALGLKVAAHAPELEQVVGEMAAPLEPELGAISPGAVSSGDTIAKGLARQGGSLESVLQGIEQEFQANPPVSAAGPLPAQSSAMNAIEKATAKLNLEPGQSIGGLPGQGDVVLQNVGGIITTIKPSGQIIVTNSNGDVLLSLLPK